MILSGRREDLRRSNGVIVDIEGVTTKLAKAPLNVVKTYDAGSQKITALQGIDLEVRVGELMMLVGPFGWARRPRFR